MSESRKKKPVPDGRELLKEVLREVGIEVPDVDVPIVILDDDGTEIPISEYLKRERESND